MKTQRIKYTGLRNSLTGIAVMVFSIILMAPSCKEDRYYEDENYPDEAHAMAAPLPQWAPTSPNASDVRYYYFPDYYMYYDVWMGQYVYWDGYHWMYSISYPGFIGPFDPYMAYVVVIDYSVYHPWRNHDYYIHHYPQHYYDNNYYGHRDNGVIRGYDENNGNPVYTPRKAGVSGEKSPDKKDLHNLNNGNENFKNRTNENLNKNRNEMPLNKRQEQAPVEFNKHQGIDNRTMQNQKMRNDAPQKFFNEQPGFTRPNQGREMPANLQKQQSPPMMKQIPGGNNMNRSGGNGRGGKH